MILRVARHTDNLDKITCFYTEIMGLQVLGSFADHEGYDGIFLGTPGESWHLEFTASSEKPAHHPDEDDLLVFYLETATDLQALSGKLKAAGYPALTPKNPYWARHAETFADPDGYRLVITKKP